MIAFTTTRGRVVIPASLRRKYGIKKGTRIIVSDDGEAIILKPVTERYLKKLQGSLKDTSALDVLREERQKDKDQGK